MEYKNTLFSDKVLGTVNSLLHFLIQDYCTILVWDFLLNISSLLWTDKVIKQHHKL